MRLAGSGGDLIGNHTSPPWPFNPAKDTHAILKDQATVDVRLRANCPESLRPGERGRP